MVGSLLRPQRWQEARQRLDEGTLTPEAFAEIETACIRDLIGLQESIGLDVVTDGEIAGSISRTVLGWRFRATTPAPERWNSTCSAPRARSRCSAWTCPIWPSRNSGVAASSRGERGSKLANNSCSRSTARSRMAQKPVKVSLIGPDRIFAALRITKVSKAVYAEMEAFVADVVAIERAMIAERSPPDAATFTSTRQALPPMRTVRRSARCGRAAKIRGTICQRSIAAEAAAGLAASTA